jgi:hypothetical protein
MPSYGLDLVGNSGQGYRPVVRGELQARHAEGGDTGHTAAGMVAAAPSPCMPRRVFSTMMSSQGDQGCQNDESIRSGTYHLGMHMQG